MPAWSVDSYIIQPNVGSTSPGLYLLDGSRASRAAIVQHAGEAAFFQRCQVHKIRNVLTTYPIPANNGSKITAAMHRPTPSTHCGRFTAA